MMDARLQTVIPHSRGRLVLKNPVLTASGTFGYGLEFAPYGNLAELGGIVSKGLSLQPRAGNAMPRIAETPAGMLNSIGLQNCGVEEFINRYLPGLPLEEVAVIANIYAQDAQGFGELAGILSGRAKGLAALEVNISCPNVNSGGMLFGQNPQDAARVTGEVKKNAGALPVMVKLSPNVTDITEIAKACEDAGADMLSCINTISGMAVDVRRREPLLANIIGGLSGPAIKPVALRCVWQVCRAVKIPVLGIGGISTAEDILEFLLVGAHAVQIGTAGFRRPDRAFALVRELSALMDELGLDELDSFRGTLSIRGQ
jgi:dihydroorotate dehydrogenase (NAD+) catalytic subunit